MNDKMSGSYYTPMELIHFMLDYLEKQEQHFDKILEPSVGDGRFVDALIQDGRWQFQSVDTVELYKEKIRQLKGKGYPINVRLINGDFLEYALKTTVKYDLIIGNPPYINFKNMTENSKQIGKSLCAKAGIKDDVMKNMWAAFVVGASILLNNGGVLFFVLPMEFLQVQYAEKLRVYLEQKFNTIHIITFNEKIFGDIEQETCLVYMTNHPKETPYISYKEYDKVQDRKAVRESCIQKNKPLTKWTNAVLDDVDIQFLKEKQAGISKIKEMGITAPGIVTGGNKYFIISEQQVNVMGAEKLVLPIIQKSQQIKDTIYLNQQLFQELSGKGDRVYLLNLADTDATAFSDELNTYLQNIAEEKNGDTKLKDRYKCKNRKPWYGVPIVNKGQVVFFKRYGLLPKVLINEMDIHTTDLGYHIALKDNYDRESFVFCFYNSLTLALCEYNGRYYGGGVAELIPSEFKELVVPYRQILQRDVKELNKMFSDKADVKEIVDFVNKKTLTDIMQKEEIDRLDKIRQRLMERRHLGV